MLLFDAPLIFRHFWPASTLLRGALALAIPSLPKTDLPLSQNGLSQNGYGLFVNDNDHDHLFSRHSSDLPCVPGCVGLGPFVDWRVSGPVPALEMEMCLCVVMCLWCRFCLYLSLCLCLRLSLSLSLSVSGGGVVAVVVAVLLVCCLLLSGGLSSMRCRLYLDIRSRRGDIIWLPLRESGLLVPFVELSVEITSCQQHLRPSKKKKNTETK